MNVLSLFDGMSCGRIALEKVGIKVDKYYASEIKANGIKVSKENYPDIIQIGDVTKVSYKEGILYTENGEFETRIDMLIGGSPCQDFSVARICTGNSRDGLEGIKSQLFYEYLRILKEINPTYFLLENVKMKKECEEELNKYIGIDGIHINSRLVSFQNRPRIYWSNIPNITIPKDKNINFQDYKDMDFDYCKEFKMNINSMYCVKMWNDGKGRDKVIRAACDNKTFSTYINCLTRKQNRGPNSGVIAFDGFGRYLTRREMELAQTVPVGYTNSVSYNQAQDLLGDGWTVDVIAHIFKGLRGNKK